MVIESISVERLSKLYATRDGASPPFTLQMRPREAAAVARRYARGTIVAIDNPEATIRLLYELYRQTRPTGKDEAAVIRDDVRISQGGS